MDKRCSRCKNTKNHSQFAKDSFKVDGLDLWCKQCRAAWRLENQDKEKSRRLRARMKKSPLPIQELNKINDIASSYAYQWRIPDLADNLAYEMIEGAFKGRKTSYHNMGIDYIRKHFGRIDPKDPKSIDNQRINLERGSQSIENVAEKDRAIHQDHSNLFIDECLQIIRDHYWGINRKWKQDSSEKNPAIFELILIWGFQFKELAIIFGVSISRISQIHEECIELLKKSLASDL